MIVGPTCCISYGFEGTFLSLQSSLFGEGGNVYNMQPGGARPGMHSRWRYESITCDSAGWRFRLDCADEMVLRCVLCGTGGYQQTGVHAPLGMNSFQVLGDERERP